MRLLAWFWLLCALSISSLALHESDVGVIDWRKELVGVPVTLSPVTAPTFVLKDVVVTATGSNVLAGLNVRDGSVAWRYIFEADDPIIGFYPNRRVVVTLSGPGGSTLRKFDTTTGALLIERSLHAPQDGLLVHPPSLGKSIAFSSDSQGLYVLSNGHTVSFLEGNTGSTLWTWHSPDQGSKTMFLKVVARKDVVYVVGATKGVASLSLNVVVLSASTGQLLHDREIPSGITNTLTDVFTFYDTDKTTEPVLVWVENTSLKSLVLDSTLSNKPQDVKTSEKLMYLLDLGLTNHGQVLAQLPDGSSRLLQVSQDGTTASSLYEFDSKRLGVLFNGGVDEQGRPYVARTHWSQDLNTIVLDVVNASSTTDQTQTYTVPFDTNNEGILDHIAFTLPSSGAPHLLTTASSGAVQLFTPSPAPASPDSRTNSLIHHWTRHEALATTTLATFVELPEPLIISTTADFTKSEGFIGRLMRHAVEARDLPRYIVNFVRRFVTGDYASATSAAVVVPGSSIPLDAEAATTNTNTNTPTTTTPQTTPLFRDPFSFRQILLTFTAPGKIFALDSSNGEIVWTRTLGLGSAFWMGGSVSARKVWVVRGVNDVVVGEGVEEGKDKVRAEVVLVAERRASNGQATTMIYHFNALTGEDVSVPLSSSDNSENNEETRRPAAPGFLEGIELVEGPYTESFLLPDGRSVVVLDEFMQAHLYPPTPPSTSSFASIHKQLSFPMKVASPTGGHRVSGYQFTLSSAVSDKPRAYEAWSLPLQEGEEVQKMFPPSTNGPVASLGKVLGNRTTLYKYLNPRLFVVVSRTHSGASIAGGVEDATEEGGSTTDNQNGTNTAKKSTGKCAIRVLDATKGSVIYHREVASYDDVCDLHASLTENWLVWHYYEGAEDGLGNKGWRVVSVEFYEGGGVDEKTRSSDMSAYSNATLDLTVYEESFVFPHGITAMAPTMTKFGITSKDMIFATKNNKLQSFPRRYLDPRRPHRKPTSEEMEEGLIQYDPVVPDDPKRVISHYYQIAGTQHILITPSLLESTSLVFSYGSLDLFLTRVSPSGTFDVLSESFNKAQLVVTICGLVGGILVVRPVVGRRKVKAGWYL